MKDNFQRSLLKGTLEVPFENIASLDEVTFDKISLIDKFLIGDTLLTYTIQASQYPFEIVASPDEKFPYTPFLAVKLIRDLKKIHLPVVSYFLTQIHIKYKRLFNPALIVEVLENRNIWIDQIIFLPKVLRERARWLSPLRTSWNWWNSIFKKETWEDNSDPMRYFHFRIMRIFKPEEASLLLIAGWQNEERDSKKLLLQIILETLRPEADYKLLEELYTLESTKIKANIRQLIFMTTNKYSDILDGLVSKSNGNLEEIIKINLGKIKELDQLFDDKKDAGLYPEVLYTMPYEKFQYKEKNNTLLLGPYLMSLKNKNILINDLFINYVFKKDINSLSALFDAALQNDEVKLNPSLLQIFSHQDIPFVNEVLLYMMTNCNSVSRWHFYRQLILFGEVSLNRKNTASLITLTTLYTKEIELNKNVMTDFFARGCFCIDPAYMDDWRLMCEDISSRSPELKAEKVTTMIVELTTFRKQLEVSFENGK